MWKSRNKIIILASLLTFNSSFLMANDGYFEDSKRGWFWGEVKKEKKKEEKKLPDLTSIKNSDFSSENLKKLQKELKKKDSVDKNIIIYNGKEYKTSPTKTNIPWEVIDTLHPDEIRKLEEETKNISITYPTKENVVEYKRLQKYITKKSLAFTDANYLVSRQNPEISNWVAETSMRNRVQIEATRENKENLHRKTLNRFKDRMIVLVATTPTCPFCHKQRPLLKKFSEIYNVEYKEVDITKNRAFGLKYQVKRTPDLFLLFRDKNDKPLLTRFGSGLHSIPDLRSGVIAGLYTFKKIPKDYLDY